MFVTSLTSDSDYFLAGKNFASLSYTGSSIVYHFTLYGRLTQALIDGNDEIKIQIIQRTDPKINYFVGDTKEDVEASNLGFVQNVKKQLQRALTNSLIKEKSIELINILPDEIVSGIGNGKINDANYFEFLPNIEQVEITRSSKTNDRNKQNYDIENFAKLTRKLFDDTGIYPGIVGTVGFPGEKLRIDGDGLDYQGDTASTKRLMENQAFSDYYTKYYIKNTNSKIKQRFTNARAEYQKFSVDIEIMIEEDYNPIDFLSAFKDLSRRVVVLIKDLLIRIR